MEYEQGLTGAVDGVRGTLPRLSEGRLELGLREWGLEQ